jgi:uncharacterized protein (TIRG00374 family)
MKKALLFSIGTLVSFIIVYELIGRNITLLRYEMVQAQYIYLIPCAFLLLLSMLARAMRWHVLLNGEINFWHSFHINNVGFLANSILPFRLGDLMRAWLTTRPGIEMAGFSVLSSIVVERVFDLLALLAMIGAIMTMLDLPSQLTWIGSIIGILTFIAIVCLAVLSMQSYWVLASLEKLVPKLPLLERLHIFTRLEHFFEGLQALHHPNVAILALIWTGISWLLDLAAAYVLLFMVFDTSSVAAVLAVMILLALSMTLPAIPGNLGPFQAAVVGGLWIGGMIASVGSPDNVPAVTVGVWLHILTLGIYLVLGLVGISVEGITCRQIMQGLRKIHLR